MKLYELTLGVLAGGQSRRMGKNKAKLQGTDGSFLEQILRQGREFRTRLVSVDQREKYRWLTDGTDFDGALVEDAVHGTGPLEGLYQLLCRCETPACMVVATDMPLLNTDFFRQFAACYRGEDVLALSLDGVAEPLCAIYARACLPALEILRRDGVRKPRLLFSQVNTRLLPVETLDCGAEVVRNVNTPEEYQNYLER